MTCIKMGSDESHFNVSLIMKDKVTRPCQHHTFWRERRAEAVSNRGPSAYQPAPLPLGQTGSRRTVRRSILQHVQFRRGNRRSSEIQGTALGKCLRAWPRPAGIATLRHAFVGDTVSTWARWRKPVNKSRKGIRNADQALAVRGEHADRIVGSPSW